MDIPAPTKLAVLCDDFVLDQCDSSSFLIYSPFTVVVGSNKQQAETMWAARGIWHWHSLSARSRFLGFPRASLYTIVGRRLLLGSQCDAKLQLPVFVVNDAMLVSPTSKQCETAQYVLTQHSTVTPRSRVLRVYVMTSSALLHRFRGTTGTCARTVLRSCAHSSLIEIASRGRSFCENWYFK